MSPEQDLSLADGLTRRRFLTRSSLLAWLATTCFVNLEGLQAAVAEAAAAGNPLLSPETVTAWIAANRRSAAFPAYIARAKADLVGTLRENFTVTAAQETWLRSLSPADRGALWNSVDTAIRENRQLLIVGGGANPQSSPHPAGAPPTGGATGTSTGGNDAKGGKITVQATGAASFKGHVDPTKGSGSAQGTVTVSTSWG